MTDSKPHEPSRIGWAIIYLVIGVVWVYTRIKDFVGYLRGLVP